MLSAQNPPPLLFMHSSGHLNTFTKTYTGSGGQLTALLYITNNYNDAPNATSTDDDIYIPCPNGWKIVWANLTLSNINAPNVTIEPNASKENFDLPLGFYAMSFKLTCNAYLDNVSVKLTVVNDDYANFYLYKAINSSGVLKPSDSYQRKELVTFFFQMIPIIGSMLISDTSP